MGYHPRTGTTTSPSGTGGAIAARIKRITKCQEDETIRHELDWQSKVEEDQAKSNAFCNQVVNQTTLQAFAFMKGKSPVVHMPHSVGQFFGMSGLVTEVQGKYIGHIGDRGNGRYPVPFILPTQNTWVWPWVKHVTNKAVFENHFVDKNNWEHLWTTGANKNKDNLTEKLLPQLLALPSFFAEYIQTQGGTCLPHSLYLYIREPLDRDTQLTQEQ